ncbi:hypothetical protein LCGC14_0585060 [marine sediment metagenome]|uniref:Uncharacterized protein n=1 Tax=marine sediment metagenome TaxID=412755 RepID=A0A0F9RK55_9ZZZZ
MSFLGELARLFMWLLIALIPTGIFATVGVYVFADVWIKRKVRGATLAVFYDNNREETSQLIHVEDDASFTLGNKDDPENPTYVIDTKKQYFRYWPPAFPRWIQQRVSTYYFRKDDPVAIDPMGQESIRTISPRMLSGIVNERLLKMSIKDAREQADGDFSNRRKFPVYILAGVGVVIVLVAINLVLSIMTSGTISEVHRVITNK